MVGGLDGAGRIDRSVRKSLTLGVVRQTGVRAENQRGQNERHDHGRLGASQRLDQFESGIQTRRIPSGIITPLTTRQDELKQNGRSTKSGSTLKAQRRCLLSKLSVKMIVARSPVQKRIEHFPNVNRSTEFDSLPMSDRY